MTLIEALNAINPPKKMEGDQKKIKPVFSEELESLYRALNWQPLYCAQLPPRWAVVMLELSMHMSVTDVFKHVQKCLDVEQTGTMTSETLNAITIRDATCAITSVVDYGLREHLHWVLRNL